MTVPLVLQSVILASVSIQGNITGGIISIIEGTYSQRLIIVIAGVQNNFSSDFTIIEIIILKIILFFRVIKTGVIQVFFIHGLIFYVVGMTVLQNGREICCVEAAAHVELADCSLFVVDGVFYQWLRVKFFYGIFLFVAQLPY